ncbi:serine O-acetyltransferase [Rhodococcus pyridinivorans]|uniref:serine O-acetyltransferase n=1 Tax=Rhodococcus pyridinivorans TaxID=103816 RepID=UPI0035589224
MPNKGERPTVAARDKIGNFQDFKSFREADLEAYGYDRWRFHYRLTEPCLYYQRILRSVELLQAMRLRRLGTARRVYLKCLGILLGISIPPGVFGRGLSIPHYGSIVVNDKVQAGKFCRIHSSTNLGEQNGEAPQLGDGVYIAPGAVLYGDIRVGDRSVVGANSVVSRDVPANVTVAGAPAQIISSKSSLQVMPRWISNALERGIPSSSGTE